jgi:hypothetical protein
MGEALADVIHHGCDKCHFRVQRRLRVKSSHIDSFDNMMDLEHTISLMGSRRRAGPVLLNRQL